MLITILFIFTESKSQDLTCPPGWTSGNVSDFIMNGTERCDFTIYYCWMIDENGQIVVRLRAVIFYDKTKLAGLDLASRAYWDLYNNLMLNKIAKSSSVQIPPCNQNTTTVISLQRVNCWHYQDLDAIFSTTYGYVNPNHSYIGLTPCDIWGAYCQITYTVCWDYSFAPPILKVVGTTQLPPMQVECSDSIGPFDPNATMSTECFSTCY